MPDKHESKLKSLKVKIQTINAEPIIIVKLSIAVCVALLRLNLVYDRGIFEPEVFANVFGNLHL